MVICSYGILVHINMSVINVIYYCFSWGPKQGVHRVIGKVPYTSLRGPRQRLTPEPTGPRQGLTTEPAVPKHAWFIRNHTRARSVLGMNSHSSPQRPRQGLKPEPISSRQGFIVSPHGKDSHPSRRVLGRVIH